jgi:flagellar hook-length control protein FliK
VLRHLQPVASVTTPSTSELGQLPAIAVASGSMPAQLLQFIDAPLQVRPYAGLQYLELTQQLMAEAARARAAGSGLYSARLDLNPPELGQMFVNIAVRGDTVAMQLAVVSGTPKEQLRESLNALRESLAEAGLDVVELRVVTLDDQPDKQQRDQQQGSDDESPVVKTTPSLLPTKSTPFISQLISAAPAVNFSP